MSHTKINNNVAGTDNGDAEQQQHVAPYSHYEMPIQSKIISFYISRPIGENALYTDMVHCIKTASEHDRIIIYINTPGGNLFAGMQIINAIRTTAAHVTTVLESHAFSLGTLIFLSGHEWIVMDDSQMMFHNFSSSLTGKGNEQIAEVQANVKWFNKIMKRICHPFLTNDEINAISDGRDLWLDSDDIRKRLSRMAKEANQVPAPKAPAKKKDDVQKVEVLVEAEIPPIKPKSKEPKIVNDTQSTETI
jgi:ATP-dependent Clp protease protease subunit